MTVTIDDIDVFPTDLPYTIRRNILSGSSNVQLNHGSLASAQSWARPYFQYTIEYNILIASVMQELENFWVAHKYDPSGIDYFLFEDPLYKEEIGTEFGIGDGGTISYRLRLDYSTQNRPFKHVKGWIQKDTETLYLDGTEIDTSDYQINYTTGVVNLDFVPDTDTILTADFKFYRKCKFMSSDFVQRARMEEKQSAQIEIREVG